jgi:hypothetical protein
MKITLKLPKPVCRTPIKPAQKHKNDVKYTRQKKHREKFTDKPDIPE